MKLPYALRSIRVRLALIIVLAMTALVGFTTYQAIDERSGEEARAEQNLQTLADFAASAERARFEAVENFMILASQAQSLVTVAKSPDDQEAFDACTRSLFVSDQLLPGTHFSLWDTNGDILCSSRAAERGEFSATERLWFTTAQQRQGFATGDFERLHQGNEPSLSFGIPIRDPATNEIIAYFSGAVQVEAIEDLLGGATLPESGRLHVIDQNGVVISSTQNASGERLDWFPQTFGSLSGYLDGSIAKGESRHGAATRITDADDALVAVVISADTDSLVTPLAEKLWRELAPVAVLTLLTLGVLWLLAQQWVVRPVGSLVAATDRLAAGRLDTRVRSTSGVSEFERLSNAFNEMADARERATQAKDEFLGLVSHELKTPITTTLGNAEILRHRGDRLDGEQRQMALEDIHDSALRLNSIIDNLLALARLERGVVLEAEPLMLLRMTQTATEEQLRADPARRVLVRGDNTALALGGETYVEQVLRNLIGNAIKYSPPDSPVEVVVERERDQAVVRVLDRGQGIEESEQEAVFQPFYRSERTATSAAGIGIGLSVCKRLLEAMGGRIWFQNRPDGGGEFGFSLPLVEEDAPLVLDEEPIAVPVTSNA